jgi:two-component system chemotaxis response regulator CheB
MQKRDIIVIGASTGGITAMKKLVCSLPADFAATVFITWHMSPDSEGTLPDILAKCSPLPVANAIDGQQFEKGNIYTAPPDHHLLVDKDCIRVSRGPKENRFRPAIDPLFRSAALSFGNRVIGIVLSGALDDGTAGLYAIKQLGGTAIVQDPADAEVGAMPRNALRQVKVDHCLPAEKIAELLVTLVASDAVTVPVAANIPGLKRMHREIDIAMQRKAASTEINIIGELTPYTCPECGGVLSRITEGDTPRYRCHTGHAFSAASLQTELAEQIDDNLWQAVRGLEESILLLNHMGDHFAENNEVRLAAWYFQKGQEATQKRRLLKELLGRNETAEQADAARPIPRSKVS